jgi:hypothetical protein
MNGENAFVNDELAVSNSSTNRDTVSINERVSALRK